MYSIQYVILKVSYISSRKKRYPDIHVRTLQVVITRPLSCSGEETWQHGNSLVNYMKLVEMDGLTGKVKFDQRGLRTDFTLEIIELKKHGLERVGSWHDQRGIEFSRNFTETYSEIVESLQNKTLVVTTIRVRRYIT